MKSKNLLFAIVALVIIAGLAIFMIVSIKEDRNRLNKAVDLAAQEQRSNPDYQHMNSELAKGNISVKLASANMQDSSNSLEHLISIAPKDYKHFQACKITDVEDGDKLTCVNERNDKVYKLSLYGVAAPVLKQAYGIQARSNLADLILNKKVYFSQKFIDKFTRLSSVIYFDSKNINLVMLSTGSAQVDIRYNEEPDYLSAEKYAYENLIGLWNKHFWEHNRPPVKPWEFNPSLVRDILIPHKQATSQATNTIIQTCGINF